MELLPVREAKKEQAEFEAQMKKEAESAADEERDDRTTHQRIQSEAARECA
jgi:hypothetical protein